MPGGGSRGGGIWFIVEFHKQVELTDDAIAGMGDQFQVEGMLAAGAEEGVGAEFLGEELGKGFTW